MHNTSPRLNHYLRPQRFWAWLCLGLLLSLLGGLAADRSLASYLSPFPTTGTAFTNDPPPVDLASTPAAPDLQTTFAAAERAYTQQDYGGAIALWRSLLPQANPPEQAALLNNISLAQQALRDWEAAEQTVHQSLTLLGWQPTDPPATPSHPDLLASALDVYGQWLYHQGQTDTALNTWQQAHTYHRQSNSAGIAIARNWLNQAQALQYLGRHLDAQALLRDLYGWLHSPTTPLPTDIQIDILLNLGQNLRLIGNLETSEPSSTDSLNALQVLEQAESLALATHPERLSNIYIELGNTYRAIAQRHRSLEASSVGNATEIFESSAVQAEREAITAYRDAITTAPDTLPRVQAQLNLLSFHLLPNAPEGHTIPALISNLQATLAQLDEGDRASLQAHLTFAHHSLKLREINSPYAPSPGAIANLLRTTISPAQTLGDPRLLGMAWGSLGHLYEITSQQSGQAQDSLDALTATEKGLAALSHGEFPELQHRLLWQLGRVLKYRGDVEGAIAAYDSAVQIIQSLRQELVILNPDVQFSFREDIEPVYRELTDLLLKDEKPSQPSLRNARQVIDSLQTLEVENYLRQSCSTATLEAVDTIVDEFDSAAFLYSIILGDRLEVILKLPHQDQLLSHQTYQTSTQIEDVVDQLRGEIEVRGGEEFSDDGRQLAQQVYRWLVEPFAETLEAQQVNTLVFVLDGILRDIPLAALLDGDQFLIQKPYGIAVSPSLQLLSPNPMEKSGLSTVVMGLSEQRRDLEIHQNFSDLIYVDVEVEQIRSTVPAKIFLNEAFTSIALRDIVISDNSPILHIATHGQFDADVNQTFILAWDKQVTLRELGDILQPRDQSSPTPLELVILSACETMQGNGQAALGLAGLALQAGARGTIASQWVVDDASTSALMSTFYRILSTTKSSKAEALRQAQVALLEANYPPYNWAAFTTLGNWL